MIRNINKNKIKVIEKKNNLVHEKLEKQKEFKKSRI